MKSRLLSNIVLTISALVLISAAVAGGWLTWRTLEGIADTTAVDRSGDAYAALGSDVALTDHNGQSRRLSDLHGKVVMLFFGYTHCPDICPATLYSMAQANALLKKDNAGSLTGVFISVDPQRDTSDRLREYVTYFDPGFIGLTGTEAQLAKVAKDFGAAFEKGDASADGGYLMGHTTFGYLLNQQGQVVQLLQPSDPPELIAKAVRDLL